MLQTMCLSVRRPNRVSIQRLCVVPGHIGLHALDAPLEKPIVDHISVVDLKWAAAKAEAAPEPESLLIESVNSGERMSCMYCCMLAVRPAGMATV